MKYLLPLLLVGCATSISELEDSYFACTADQAEGCDLIAEEIDRRIDIQKARAESKHKSMCVDFGNRCYFGKDVRSTHGGNPTGW